MSRPNRNSGARQRQTGPSLYSTTSPTKIVGELEAGRVPWVQPWGTAAAKAPLGLPRERRDRNGRIPGVNVLLLWGAVIEHVAYPSQSWLTFRQALSLGGNVRKGEGGTTVVYADRFVPEDEKRRARETGEDAQAIPFLKRFTVFNTAQCDGLAGRTSATQAAAPTAPTGLIEPRVEALIKAATGIDFRIGGNRALYAHRSPDYRAGAARRRPISSPSTGTARRCTRWATRPATHLASGAGSLGLVRHQEVRLRGAGRRDQRSLLLRLARHRADRPARRLRRLLARGAARGRPRHRARRQPGQAQAADYLLSFLPPEDQASAAFSRAA